MDAIHALFRPHPRACRALLTLFATLLVGWSLAVLVPSSQAYAIDYDGYDGMGDITLEQALDSADVTKEHFDRLGLSFDEGIVDQMQAPFPEDRATSLFAQREVYVEANGANANAYTVRDVLDVLGTTDTSKSSVKKTTSVYDDYGQLDGAYDFYRLSNKTPKSDKGGGVGGYLSSNTYYKPKGGVLNKAGAGFSGKYATSVAYSATGGGDSKDDHVAELRADGSGSAVMLGGSGSEYSGNIHLDLFSLDENGVRTKLATLQPTINASQVCANSTSTSSTSYEFKYLDAGYFQEYDAYFELEAGDVDGDGFDELFVYAGAYRDEGLRRLAIVDMFKTTDGSSYTHHSVEVDAGSSPQYATEDDLRRNKPDAKNRDGVSNFWRWQLLKTAPVVTIATGDLDRNGTDEVALTVSAPSSHNNVAEVAACHIFNWDGGNLRSADIGEGGKGVVSLAVGDADVATSGSAKGTAMVSANCTFGTFLVPDTSCYTTALLLAGYQSTSATSHSNDAYTRFGYRYVYYDIQDACVKVGEYRTHALGTDGKRIAKSAVSKAGNARRYKPTLAPFALATARLEALDASAAMSDHVLAGGDIYGFSLLTGFSAAEIGSMSLTTAQCNQSGHNKSKDQVWIGDVVSGIVSRDNLAHESFLAVVGVHRDEDLRGSDDYYWMDLAHFTFSGGSSLKPSTGQEGVVCESNRASKRAYGTYVSLCLPDIGTDSVRIRFVGKDMVVSSPEVLAILQDSPTFKALDDVYGYVEAGSTSFGKSDAHGATNGFYIGGGAGVQADGKVGFIVEAKVQASGQVTGSYQYQWTNTVSYGVSYTAKGGKGNKVVVYSVPSIYYKYQFFDPDSQKWIDYYMPMKAEPVTSVVSVDAWNQVAAGTTSLYPIDSNVISSVSGDPATYVGGLAGKTVYAYKEFATATTLTASEGASTSQPIDTTWEDEHNFTLGGSACLSFAFGAGFLKNEATVGPVINFDFGYTHTEVHTKNTSFVATVDNLPELDSLANKAGAYSFDWKLVVKQLPKETDANGKKVKKFGDAYLVGYEVANVHKPGIGEVSLARVSQATDSSVTLTWGKADFGIDATEQNSAYAIGMLAANGTDVASWRYARPSDTEYTWTGLNASTPYGFVMRAMRGSWSGDLFNPTSSSIPTAAIQGATLAKGESCLLEPIRTVQPQGGAVTAGEPAIYEAEAAWTLLDDNGLPAGRSDGIYYLWQKKDLGSKEWVGIAQGYGNCDLSYDLSLDRTVLYPDARSAAAIPDLSPNLAAAPEPEGGQDAAGGGGSSAADSSVSRLTLSNTGAEDDGTLFRCRVGFNNQALTTSTVVLHVDDAAPASVTAPVLFNTIGESMHESARVFLPASSDATPVDNQDNPADDEGDDTIDNADGNGNGGNNGIGQGTVNRVAPAAVSKASIARAAAPTSDEATWLVPLLMLAALCGAAGVGLVCRRRSNGGWPSG